MLTIKFYTFNRGHLVSDKEFERLKKGFIKVGMNLIRGDEEGDYDIIMVKGFSYKYEDIPKGKPIVYLSIGTEWKEGIDLKEANKDLDDLYRLSDAVIHISEYCKMITHKVFGKTLKPEYVIIPACEPNLPEIYPEFNNNLKIATTCIPRPVKRFEEVERLCKKHGIELTPALGNVSDFSYYHGCHAYIHLSRKEGMPNTVLEALSYGLPCIVTNHGGAKEVAQIVIKNDSEDTMWNMSNIEPVDDYLFEEAIEKLKKDLPNLRLRVREKVLSELNDKVTALKFKEVFQKLI